MSIFLLSENEAQLRSAIEAGAPFSVDVNSEFEIRGDALRAFVAGSLVRAEADEEPRKTGITASGIQIQGVKIVGRLVLDHLADADGSFLPPLMLRACAFQDTVSLRRAKFRLLSFAESRLQHLCATGLHLADSLDLSLICSPSGGSQRLGCDGRGQCWVELDEARIGGSLISRQAILVAPATRVEIISSAGRARYALDLRAASIEGELLLAPAFSAFGGVNCRSLRLERDLVMTGASLSAGEDYALCAERAKIGGSALFDVHVTDNGPIGFSGKGTLTFLDATIGGSLDFRGARIGSLLANNARIHGAVLAGAWKSPTKLVRFEATGGVDLEATQIGGSIDMSGAHLERLNAHNAKIGGGFLLNAYQAQDEVATCYVHEKILISNTNIGGNVDLSGATVFDLIGHSTQIGGSVYLRTHELGEQTFHFISHGNVDLTAARINGNIIARGASIQKTLSANNSYTRGAVFLREWTSTDKTRTVPFAVGEDVFIMGCHISGNLEMAGASIRNLFAAGAQIDGGVFLLTWSHAVESLRFTARGRVSLTGAKIGGNLEMSGAWVQNMEAQNADIGGSAFLRACEDSKLPFYVGQSVFLIGANIRADLDLSGAELCGQLSAQISSVGGNVWLVHRAGLPFKTRGGIDISGSKIGSTLLVKQIEAEKGVAVDLSHSYVEVLADDNGTAWGDAIHIRLEGFHYSRLAASRPSNPGRNQLNKSKGETAVARRRWLNLQYPLPDRRPNLDDYSPDAYDRLTRAFRANGYFIDSRVITKEKLKVERRISETIFARPFLVLYAFFFDSGLSPRRATTTFLAFLAIGFTATFIADRGIYPYVSPILVIETSTTNSIAVQREGRSHYSPAIPKGAAESASVEELPCGHEIEPLLYALDVFIPALELHQEQRCRITTRPAGFYWRIARAVYAVLGWIVTALTVLTVSGFARRHLQD